MAKREIGEINAGSMADIAFLLLIFFLVTTTMDVDTGIARQLPPIPEKPDQEISEEINERNIFIVLINSDDRLLVNRKPMELSELHENAKKFVKSNPNDASLPEMDPTVIAGIDNSVLVSKGIISLRNDRGTTYGRYIEVQDVLVAVYNELRNEAAFDYFGKRTYDELDDVQQKAIRQVYPQRISEAEPKNIGGN